MARRTRPRARTGPNRFAWRGRLLLTAAGSIFIASVLLYFVPGAVLTLLGKNTVMAKVAMAVAAFVVGLLSVFLALGRGQLRSQGHRHLVRDAHHAMSRDPRPPVLYLRSFSIDPAAAWPQVVSPLWPAIRTVEEQLSSALARIGPLIAIGQPGELPRLGAARLYVPDDWHSTVLRLMKAARLVVLGAGRGEGLLWELRHAVSMLPPTRLVLLIPFDPQGYRVFREAMRTYFPRPLPDYPPGKPAAEFAIKGAVYFGPDWTPHVVRFDTPPATRRQGNETFQKAVVRALRPVFDMCNWEAEAWWGAAETGDLRAMRILALWRARVGLDQETEAWYRRAVTTGSPAVIRGLATRVQRASRSQGAEDLWRQTAETGNSGALWTLAEWLAQARDGQETEAWYRRAAETGHPDAMWALADWLERAGNGYKTEWLERFRIGPGGHAADPSDPPTLASDQAT